jgi:hypothetical protein
VTRLRKKGTRESSGRKKQSVLFLSSPRGSSLGLILGLTGFFSLAPPDPFFSSAVSSPSPLPIYPILILFYPPTP